MQTTSNETPGACSAPAPAPLARIDSAERSNTTPTCSVSLSPIHKPFRPREWGRLGDALDEYIALMEERLRIRDEKIAKLERLLEAFVGE